MVDDEFSRAETLRFASAKVASFTLSLHERMGYRTESDRSVRTTRIPTGHASLVEQEREQKPVPEEIPLAGSNPHCEWP